MSRRGAGGVSDDEVWGLRSDMFLDHIDSNLKKRTSDGTADLENDNDDFLRFYVPGEKLSIVQMRINAQFPKSWQAYAAETLKMTNLDESTGGSGSNKKSSPPNNVSTSTAKQRAKSKKHSDASRGSPQANSSSAGVNNNNDDNILNRIQQKMTQSSNVTIINARNKSSDTSDGGLPSGGTNNNNNINGKNSSVLSKRDILQKQATMFGGLRPGEMADISKRRSSVASTQQSHNNGNNSSSSSNSKKNNNIANGTTPRSIHIPNDIGRNLPICLHSQFMTHPKSLSINVLNNIILPNLDTFYVTTKTNGVRLWLIFTRDLSNCPIAALVNRSGAVWMLDQRDMISVQSSMYKDTLLDGELVLLQNDDGTRSVNYVVFDVISAFGIIVSHRDFKCRQVIASKVCSNIKWRGVVVSSKSWISLKVFFLGMNEQSAEMYGSIDYMMSSGIDGWIIQHSAVSAIELPPSINTKTVQHNLMSILQNETFGNPYVHHGETQEFVKHVVDVWKFKPIQTLDFWCIIIPKPQYEDDDGSESFYYRNHDKCIMLLTQEEFTNWNESKMMAVIEECRQWNCYISGSGMSVDPNCAIRRRRCMCGWFPMKSDIILGAGTTILSGNDLESFWTEFTIGQKFPGIEVNVDGHSSSGSSNVVDNNNNNDIGSEYYDTSSTPLQFANSEYQYQQQQQLFHWITEHFSNDMQKIVDAHTNAFIDMNIDHNSSGAGGRLVRSSQLTPPVYLLMGLVEFAIVHNNSEKKLLSSSSEEDSSTMMDICVDSSSATMMDESNNNKLSQIHLAPLKVRRDKSYANGMSTVINTLIDSADCTLDAKYLYQKITEYIHNQIENS